MISGSLRVSGVIIACSGTTPTAAAPVSAPAIVEATPSAAPQADQGSIFSWAVIGPDLGTHQVGDRIATTLSATYNGGKVTSYQLQAGSLPTSLSFDPAEGLLIGTVTEVGHFVFTIRARVNDQVSDASYSLTVD